MRISMSGSVLVRHNTQQAYMYAEIGMDITTYIQRDRDQGLVAERYEKRSPRDIHET